MIDRINQNKGGILSGREHENKQTIFPTHHTIPTRHSFREEELKRKYMKEGVGGVSRGNKGDPRGTVREERGPHDVRGVEWEDERTKQRSEGWKGNGNTMVGTFNFMRGFVANRDPANRGDTGTGGRKEQAEYNPSLTVYTDINDHHQQQQEQQQQQQQQWAQEERSEEETQGKIQGVVPPNFAFENAIQRSLRSRSRFQEQMQTRPICGFRAENDVRIPSLESGMRKSALLPCAADYTLTQEAVYAATLIQGVWRKYKV